MKQAPVYYTAQSRAYGFFYDTVAEVKAFMDAYCIYGGHYLAKKIPMYECLIDENGNLSAEKIVGGYNSSIF